MGFMWALLELLPNSKLHTTYMQTILHASYLPVLMTKACLVLKLHGPIIDIMVIGPFHL